MNKKYKKMFLAAFPALHAINFGYLLFIPNTRWILPYIKKKQKIGKNDNRLDFVACVSVSQWYNFARGDY